MFWFIFLQWFILAGVMKILIQEWRLMVKEAALLIILGIAQSYLFGLIGIFAAFTQVMLFLIFLKSKKYNIKKSLILAALTMIIVVLFDHVASFLGERIFLLDYSSGQAMMFYHLPTAGALSLGFTLILVKSTKTIRRKVNQNEQLQTILMSIFLLILGSFYGSIILGIYLGNTIDIIELNLLFFVVYTSIAIISFYFYAKSLHQRHASQKQKAEQEILQRYTNEIEQQYSEMRKFKHDYENIMSSLESFIDEGDYEGLRHYFLNKIKTNSQKMLSEHFQLEQLSRIKITEIKSILAVKLMVAQGQDIDVTFEAVEKIDNIVVDSFVLVRTLGILLDNAIEALTELKEGVLSVAVFKSTDTTTFVIQNTCCPNIPPVHQLMQEGFSTKGEGRGVGLSNVKEFTQKHPNLSLQTSISSSKDQFTQKIIVGG